MGAEEGGGRGGRQSPETEGEGRERGMQSKNGGDYKIKRKGGVQRKGGKDIVQGTGKMYSGKHGGQYSLREQGRTEYKE